MLRSSNNRRYFRVYSNNWSIYDNVHRCFSRETVPRDESTKP